MLRTLIGLYGWLIPRSIATKFFEVDMRPGALLCWFWQAKRFETAPLQSQWTRVNVLTYALRLGMLAQIMLGIAFLIDWARFGTVGAWEFGVALLVSYPLVWVHLLALKAVVIWLVYFLWNPKKAGRAIVCAVLERQVQGLRKKHHFAVVAVAGSIGKTSTKLAVAEMLSVSKRVRFQTGNYNDRVTVPLIFFGQAEPNIMDVRAWLKIFRSNAAQLKRPYQYDVVVVELGTDHPGQMKAFAYIRPDITVLTAVTPEHMEYFKTLDAVASEELSVFDYSKQVLLNGDDTPGKYLIDRQFSEYSMTSPRAVYNATRRADGLRGSTLSMKLNGNAVKGQVAYLGEQGAKLALAAAATADMLGLSTKDIAAGLTRLQPFAGRMRILAGVKDSTIIDDTYNASPAPVMTALDVLYGAQASQRIAILGNMNELGDYSREAHTLVGDYCDPKKLDLVVTIGTDANKYLAEAARKRGCKVETFKSPYEAGKFVKSKLKKSAVVLGEGSQNGVFAEEVLKPLLGNTADESNLVRQSNYWLAQKHKQFHP